MQQRIGGWLAAFCLGLGPAGLASAQFQHPGGVVTAAQIAHARSALAAGEEPWESAWVEVLARAQEGLSEAPSAVVIFHDPGYYNDPVAHEAAKKNLRDDVNSAYACALTAAIGHGLSAGQKETYRAKARALLDNWANVNETVSGTQSGTANDGALVMAYVGTAFISTAELLYADPNWTAQDRAEFTNWVDSVVRQQVVIIEARPHNWGSWGVFAGLASAHWRGDEAAFAQHAARLRGLIDSQIDDSGDLPLELARGAKGIWYTYFSLAPLTHAAGILRNATGENLFQWQPPSGGSLEQALGRFYAMAESPGTMDPPLPSNWGGDLLLVTGSLYGKSDWTAWADPPISGGNSAWKTPDLLHLPESSLVASLVVGSAVLAILARCRSARGSGPRRCL